jgi:hypothetical protein
VKPTDLEKFEPRRDGWFEHAGTWGEVTVGTFVGSPGYRSQAWEIIETSHGTTQIPFGNTLWFRAREQKTGQEVSIPPRLVTTKAIILTRDPMDTECPGRTAPTDSEAVMLLVRELGAEFLAEKDEETGVIHCPDYEKRSHVPGRHRWGNLSQGLTEHMRYAHSMSVDDGLDIMDLIPLHGRAHSPRDERGKGGFPHLHTPELDRIFL